MSLYTTQLSEQGTVAVDDMILVKGAQTGAGSHMLEGFKPLFSAEAVTRLEKNGYTVSGKTHVGEFGLDLVGEFSYYNKQEGTLKGAAAELVAQGAVEAALGVDMNGAPRRAAALSGVDFLKPTYGTVSRYGIISCAASGEQLGVYAKDAEGIAKVMGVIAGYDEKDGTCLKEKNYTFDAKMPVAGKKVAIVKELVEKADDATRAKVAAFAEKLRANGVVVEEISLDIFEVANTTWQILMTAETCNNVSRYDGVKFGYRAKEYKNIDELYVNSRTEGFNFLTKAVILYGSDVLSKNRYDACYGNALKVRRVVADRITEVLSQYDAILTPACGQASYQSYEMKDAFVKVFGESVYTAVANLIGIPALVSGGVELMGKQFSESVLLSLAGSTERIGE